MGMQDLRNQFRRSRLGYSWVLVHLLMMAGCIGYVYGFLFHQDLASFFPYLICGIVVWNFVVATCVQGCQTFIISEGYIKQFSYPKQIYILRIMLSHSMNFLVGLSVCLLVAMACRIPIWAGLPQLLIGIILLLTICLGHVIIFAYNGTKYRDLSPAISGMTLMVFYLTPIVFTPDMLKAQNLAYVYLFNPVYYLIEIIRYPLLHGTFAEASIYLTALGYGLIIWCFALFILFRNDRKVVYWL